MLQNSLSSLLSLLKAIPYKYYVWAGSAFVVLMIFPKNITFTVNPGERGLVITLGKLEEYVLDEGTHFINPYLSYGKIINVRIRKTDVDSTVRTKDLQRLSTKLSINWKIDSNKVREVYQQVGSEDTVNTLIVIPVFDEIIKASVPTRNLEKILAEREILKEEIKEKTIKRLASSGVQVTDVSFVNLTASEEFTKASEERQVAEQQAMTAKIVGEKRIKEAELKALEAKKNAEALVNKARGEAEAQKLLQQTLTPQLLQKQAIEKWNGQYPTVVGGSNTLPLINISPASKQKDSP